MNLRAYIVDDHPHAIEFLSKLIETTDGVELVGWDTNPVIALNKILSGVVIADIIFLDIEMPEMSGKTFAQYVSGKVEVVFITSYTTHALDAFDIGVIDYLTKPVKLEKFIRTLDRVRQRIAKRSKSGDVVADTIYFKVNEGKLVPVLLDDIVWIEAVGKYTRIYINGQSSALLTSNQLNQIDAFLPAALFVRIHKSYMINIRYIGLVSYNEITLKTSVVLKIGPSYMDDFLKRLNRLR